MAWLRIPDAHPQLCGGGLLLRELAPEDLDAWFARLSDPETAALAGDPVATSVQAVHEGLAHHRRAFRAKKGLRWAIVPDELGASVGTIGLEPFDVAALSARVGCAIGRAHWGRGLATTAGRLVLAYAFDELGLARIEAEVLANNAASLRVLRKLGFAPEPGAPDGWLRYARTMGEVDPAGPHGDAARHLPLAELDAGLAALPGPDKDRGRVALIVRRLPDHRRETPQRVEVTPEEGVPGDDWVRRHPAETDAQLAVMRRDVAALIANGQDLTLFGDNLFVDLDLSAANLPLGTRLAVGGAVVEVTAKPHNGCKKFQARFGPGALRFVQAKETRSDNRRGIYWKVVEPGTVEVGAPIRVLSRP